MSTWDQIWALKMAGEEISASNQAVRGNAHHHAGGRMLRRAGRVRPHRARHRRLRAMALAGRLRAWLKVHEPDFLAMLGGILAGTGSGWLGVIALGIQVRL